MALTDKQASSTKPSEKSYKLVDTLGLYLLVKPKRFPYLVSQVSL